MHILSSSEILHIWEVGAGLHPVDCALLILRVALPECSQNELCKLPIGQRNAQLMRVRAWLLGDKAESFALCPNCQEKLEFTLNLTQLIGATTASVEDVIQQIVLEGYTLSVRLPDSQDLAAIAALLDKNTARALLVQRCILQSSREDTAIAPEQLPETVVTALIEQVAKSDPLAEIELDLTCPACNHNWQTFFDIVPFLWTELGVQAKRLLREVHVLAQAYGWCERDILAMSAIRRQLYIEMVS